MTDDDGISTPLRSTILRILPDFCWQTVGQVMSMIEGLSKNVRAANVMYVLHELAKDGRIEVKEAGIRTADGSQKMTERMYKAFDRRKP